MNSKHDLRTDMDRLDEQENKSIYIIREAYHHFRHIAMLWSIGKDSTSLLWMCRKAFFGAIPFPVIHIDTAYKFPAIYRYRDQMAKEWGLNLIVAQNKTALENGVGPHAGSKLDCCNMLKTDALKQVMEQYGFKAVLLGIRRDEHGIRAKERYMSPRDACFKWQYQDQPPELWDQYQGQISEKSHLRIHPLLHMSELDIWQYIEREKITVIDLYYARNGRRYRSIGCQPCCKPVESSADSVRAIVEELKLTKTAERSGRAQDKEDVYTMQKLRSLGYM